MSMREYPHVSAAIERDVALHDRILAMLAEHPFRDSTTIPSNPHSYTLRKDWADEDFDAVVKYIYEHGQTTKFKGWRYCTIFGPEHFWWVNGFPVNETTVINRKPNP